MPLQLFRNRQMLRLKKREKLQNIPFLPSDQKKCCILQRRNFYLNIASPFYVDSTEGLNYCSLFFACWRVIGINLSLPLFSLLLMGVEKRTSLSWELELPASQLPFF